MEAKSRLIEVLETHGGALPQYGWPSEVDRWMELLVCLLHQVRREGSIAEVREALAIWRDLGLITPAELLHAAPGEEDETALRVVLKRHGFTDDEAREAVGIARGMARAMVERYGGKIQRCLRRHAEAARDELAEALGTAGVPPAALRFALTHWLQNTTNAPVSLEHDTVVEFCRAHGATMEELRDAADELDLNLSQLDDLLELERASRGEERP